MATDDQVYAAVQIQRWWRNISYTWAYSHPPVRLPPSPSDVEVIPAASLTGKHAHRSPVPGIEWHLRLTAAHRKVKAAAGLNDPKIRLAAELEYCSEVGKFAAACRSCVVLCIKELSLDPHGLSEELGDTTALDRPNVLPRRVLPSDPQWPLVRPRFDGDRVFAFDSIVVTIVGGNVTGRANEGYDHQLAWKLYAHDAKGMQALADAIVMVNCTEKIVPPVGVLVDYMGFRALCRPQALTQGAPSAEFVLGPLSEASAAYGGPGDISTIVRNDSVAAEAAGYLLNEWDARNGPLRCDFENLSRELGLLGYPVTLHSDLPLGSLSTTCVRLYSGPGGEAEYHFRTPAELMPPEVYPDTQQTNPTKRLRREALSQLQLPALSPTLKGAGLRAGTRTTGHVVGNIAATAYDLKEAASRVRAELPSDLLYKLGEEGPPLDSAGWAKALHSVGLNMRHLGLVAKAASLPAASALHREALARASKWLLRKALWSKLPWAVLASLEPLEETSSAARIAASEVVALFNLVLGASEKSEAYWRDYLVPEAVRRFGVDDSNLARRKVVPRALFHAMEHHLGVRFRKTVSQRPFFNPGYPEPLKEADLELFSARYAKPLFPHLEIVKRHWESRLKLREGYGLLVPEKLSRPSDDWMGFYPRVRICACRGLSYSASVAAAPRHLAQNRWDRVCDAKKLELTILRTLGESSDVIGETCQGLSVSLLETALRANGTAIAPSFDPASAAAAAAAGRAKPDEKRLLDSLYSADAAFDMLPTYISAWWGQLAAVEDEWYLGRSVSAQSRLQRMRREWSRCASDQPVLMLRLEGTIARHMAVEADWRRAAFYTERCCQLADVSFGKTHPATLALKTRHGECWSRQEDWSKAATAYQQALACAEAAGDEGAVAKLSYELARVLYMKGDLAASKPFAEQVVKLLLPKFWDRGAIVGSDVAPLGLESLHLLAQLYESIVFRGWEASKKGCGVWSGAVTMELIDRTIRCYENYLRHLSLENVPRASGLTRPAEVIERIVRLKALCMGTAERAELLEQIEELILSQSLADGDMEGSGTRSVQPRAQTRAIAEAALESRAEERPERLIHLYEAVAREAIVNNLDPSDWYDDVVRKMQEGVAGSHNADSGAYQATLSLLDISRYFGIFSLGGPSLRKEEEEG